MVVPWAVALFEIVVTLVIAVLLRWALAQRKTASFLRLNSCEKKRSPNFLLNYDKNQNHLGHRNITTNAIVKKIRRKSVYWAVGLQLQCQNDALYVVTSGFHMISTGLWKVNFHFSKGFEMFSFSVIESSFSFASM